MITTKVIDDPVWRHQKINELAGLTMKAWKEIEGLEDWGNNPFRQTLELIAGPFSSPNVIASVGTNEKSIVLVTAQTSGLVVSRVLLGPDSVALTENVSKEIRTLFMERIGLYKCLAEEMNFVHVLGACDICGKEYHDSDEGMVFGEGIQKGRSGSLNQFTHYRHTSCNVAPPFPIPPGNPFYGSTHPWRMREAQLQSQETG